MVFDRFLYIPPPVFLTWDKLPRDFMVDVRDGIYNSKTNELTKQMAEEILK